jgi:hypothetical protein
MFNNVYFSGSTPPSPAGANDTADYRLSTYSTSVSLSGGKTSDVQAVLGGNVIADVGTTSWNTTIQPNMGSNNLTIHYVDATTAVVATKAIFINLNKIGDINGDGKVDGTDLSIFASFWGQTGPGNVLTDLNGDGKVDGTDLSIFASHWGQ